MPDDNNPPAVRPSRRTRSEILLRLLISSSYPHAVLGDLAVAFSRHANEYDITQRESLDVVIAGTERQFDMFDFIRCIDIKRKDGAITITIKRLDFEPTTRDIVDTPDKQEFMASIQIDLDPPEKSLDERLGLAELLLGIYFYCQMKPTDTRRNVRNTIWTLRERINKDLLPAKLSDKRAAIKDSKMGFHEAVNYIAHSLSKDSFRIILTQKTILLLAPHRRMWGHAL